ncbi:MAG: DUF6335 family protein [Candidatus Promineifilaceae bacterium]
MEPLTVTAVSNTTALINIIVSDLRDGGSVTLQARGKDAIKTLLQTISRIRRLGLLRNTPIRYASDRQTNMESSRTEPVARLSLSAAPEGDEAGAADWSAIEEEIEAQFKAWEVLPDEDSPLAEKLREHNSESPILSGGDVDAAWDQADVGEETVGGTVATPDQDVVDELGEAAGLTYEEGEPLHTGDKLEARDRHRWELDPRSADEADER